MTQLLLAEVIEYLEMKAKHEPWFDDIPIVILPESTMPIIVMNQAEFNKMVKKLTG
jgi:hypothetical protein